MHKKPHTPQAQGEQVSQEIETQGSDQATVSAAGNQGPGEKPIGDQDGGDQSVNT